MAVKATKQISVLIDGQDVENLGSLLELARRRLQEMRQAGTVEYSSEDMHRLSGTLDKLFEAVQ